VLSLKFQRDKNNLFYRLTYAFIRLFDIRSGLISNFDSGKKITMNEAVALRYNNPQS
jgi:hypothetical protein